GNVREGGARRRPASQETCHRPRSRAGTPDGVIRRGSASPRDRTSLAVACCFVGCAMHHLLLLSFLAMIALATPCGATPTTVTDVQGRAVTVDAPAERVVVVFNFEEFTAIAGKEAWERVVAYNHTPWRKFRHSIWQRYVDAIPRIATLPDVG